MIRYAQRNDNPTPFPRPEGMPPALHRLLMLRGIGSAREAETYLNPGVGSLHDPLLLSDMAAAARRLRAAMDAGEAICVYGDYDVDGVCASAILSGWLKSAGAKVEVYLPSRHREGYGLNEAAVREIAKRANLMVTVDCGVNGVELVALAKSLGMDVIVTDHHEPAAGPLPDCPVVNPLLNGYPFPHLCGAGVAWKLVWAMAGEAAAMAWVDVAAIATVADVVSLTGENRAIVRMGLDAINGGAARRTGIEALIAAAGLSGKPVSSTAIAFQLAPRLNAGGRLGSAERSLDLLLEADPARAGGQAAELEAENARRRDVEQQILREAEAQLESFDFVNHRALILAGRDWNPGVIGLAASRLVERYNYPVVLLADQGDRLTGSCRSIESVDIHAALTGCADTIQRFGGHRQAAGLTLAPGMLEPFRAAMDRWLSENVDPSAYIPVCRYDDALDFEAVTPALIAALEAVQPTGFGNPAPLFRATAQVVEARAVGVDGAHLKLTLAQGGRRLGGIAFREGGRADGLTGAVDALFVPKLNTYMGRTEPQLEVRALSNADAIARLSTKVGEEPRLICEFLTEMLYNSTILNPPGALTQEPAATPEQWLAERPQGTLIVASELKTAARLLRRLKDFPLDLYVGELPTDRRAFNAVCVCPAARAIPPGYGRVVLAGVPAIWPVGTPEQVLRVPAPPDWLALLPDLDAMRAAYRALMRVLSRPAWFRSVWQLAGMTAEEAGQPAVTAAASLLAMIDMGLFRLEAGEGALAVRRSDCAKASPQDSAIWNLMQKWRVGQGF